MDVNDEEGLLRLQVCACIAFCPVAAATTSCNSTAPPFRAWRPRHTQCKCPLAAIIRTILQEEFLSSKESARPAARVTRVHPARTSAQRLPCHTPPVPASMRPERGPVSTATAAGKNAPAIPKVLSDVVERPTALPTLPQPPRVPQSTRPFPAAQHRAKSKVGHVLPQCPQRHCQYHDHHHHPCDHCKHPSCCVIWTACLSQPRSCGLVCMDV